MKSTKEYSPDAKDILAELEINGEVFYGILTSERSVSVPIWIHGHKQLSDRAIRVWGYLKGALNGSFDIKGTSHVALSEVLNTSDRSVRRAIYELRDVGAITIQPRFKNGKQTKSAYYLWPAEAPSNIGTVGDEPKKSTRKKKVVVTYPVEFAKIWEIYPRKLGKGKAFESFNKTISDGLATFDQLMQATINYAKEREGKSDRYTLYASTFLGSSKKWEAWLHGSAPDIEKFVMSDDQKMIATIYDDYDFSATWINSETDEVILENPAKYGYSRPTNNLGQPVNKNGEPYAIDSASGKRTNI